MRSLYACLSTVILSASSAHAVINVAYTETPSGVDISYSGTWDVGKESVTPTLAATSRAELSLDSDFLSLTMNGDEAGSFYFVQPLVEDASPTGSAPLYVYPSVDLYSTGTSVTGTLDTDAFGLDVDINGNVSIIGSVNGWSPGDTISGSAIFTDQTLSTIGLTPGSGSFTAAGQTINWSVSSIPEPSTFSILAGGLALVFARRKKFTADTGKR